MAETEKKIEAVEAEVKKVEKDVAEAANPQADAPKKNAVAAEPSHLKNDAEDLGAAVVKSTDSNPDASKKISKVSGQAPQKDAGAADAMPKLKEEDEKETEGSKEKSETKDKEETKEVKEEVSEEDTIDVTADVEALVKDEDLSEEFKAKATTIFEAAVKSKVNEEKEKLEEAYAKKLEENTESQKAELVEKVDSYLNYVVEEWMKDNAIAIERGIKGEIAEDFISGLKKLFEDHYIDVPDEKYDVLEDQANKIETLEKKLNEQIEKNVDLSKENGKLVRQDIIDEMSADLADVSKEKFNKLAEEVEFTNKTDFETKIKTIKESYFGAKEVSNDLDDVAVGNDSQVDTSGLSNSMAAYTAAISKTKDIKLSK